MDTPEGREVLEALASLSLAIRSGSTDYPRMDQMLQGITRKISRMDSIIWDVRIAVEE